MIVNMAVPVWFVAEVVAGFQGKRVYKNAFLSSSETIDCEKNEINSVCVLQ